MKNRITEYFAEQKDKVESRQQEIKQMIASELEKNQSKILKNFQSTFETVFQKAINMQKEGAKGPIAYVCISILRSSLITKTYDLRIDLYDKNLYLDRAECETYLEVAFMFQFLDRDREYFTKCAREKMVRIQDAEMIDYMRVYQEYYFELLEEFCAERIDCVVEIPTWKMLKKEPEVKITYGEFLEKGTIIKTEKNQGDEGGENRNER